MSTLLATPDVAPGGKTRAGRFYQPELDALRFFAFFGVFVFHAAPHTMNFYASAGAPSWLARLFIATFGAGAYGVDLFFALSAYLITSLLLRERASQGAIDLRGFYVRRILRIWPLYLAFVVFAGIAARVIPGQALPLRYIAGYCLLAGNWIYVFHGLPASFAIPLWTVSIEEQFYLLWPLALRRVRPRSVAVIAIGVLIFANLLRIGLAIAGAPVDAMEYNTFTRLDPIALGTLIALFGHRLPTFSRWQRVALLGGGVVAWIAAYAFSVSSNPPDVSSVRLAAGHAVTAVASVAILLSVLGSQNQFLRHGWLLYLGKISYGLYVVHELAHLCASWLVHAATPLQVLAQSAVALVFTILLAAASYRWLESPFLRLKERFAHVQSRPV